MASSIRFPDGAHVRLWVMDARELPRSLFAIPIWITAGVAMFWLEDQLDLANLSMLLVLASALSAIWLPGWVSVVTSAVAVLAFNWFMVPPKFTFQVDVQQNAVLLAALLVVNWIIAGVMVRQRRLADAAQAVADREARLRHWGDTLRDAADPAAHAEALRTALHDATGCSVSVMVLHRWAQPLDAAAPIQVGEPSDEQQSGLALCAREGKAMGTGCGRYDDLPDTYLPLRGRGITLGSALIVNLASHPDVAVLRPHLQALCDQMGVALHRSLMAEHERLAREQAQLQSTRNALLASISHDYRTPLATIMGAASSLTQQAERMDAEQRQRLAWGILEESERLARLTENTLQLARLDAPAVTLGCDWESAEEIVGAALRRARRRSDGQRIHAWVEPMLPLLWCDAMLMSQLLDNLLDNGLKYSPVNSPVELHVRREGEQVVFSVRDEGPGIAPAWQQKVFEVFQRGESVKGDSGDAARGAGVGLAVCRAIARAHRGDLTLMPRGEGGCVFECRLPLRDNTELSPPGRDIPEAAT